MTELFNRQKTYKPDHTKYGGKILFSDFNTDYRGKDNTYGSTIAARIIADKVFDDRCKRNMHLPCI